MNLLYRLVGDKRRKTLIGFILLVALFELVRTAWISDDALITLRTVLNFLNGYGAVFNTGERVQAYTHPLWFLLLSMLSLITPNVFAATFLLSIGLSLAVLWLFLTRITRNFRAGLLAVCALLFSKAYVDFSTSGLENPLSHLLILFAVLSAAKAYERPGPGFAELAIFFLTSSLLYLSRPDLILLLFPLALLLAANNRQKPGLLCKALIIGALPALLWTLFSIYYYGFPFPNTAYAKLGAGISLSERLIQGLRYCQDSLSEDPLTLVFVSIGTVVGLRSSVFDKMLASGSVLYILYVISIGGDFMSGRFFTAPLLVAAVLTARRTHFPTGPSRIIAAATMSVLALINLPATLLSGPGYRNPVTSQYGIADERGYYYPAQGLLPAWEKVFQPFAWQKVKGRPSVSIACGGLGLVGLLKGPDTHLIDVCALADPLLARLPAKYNPGWRIGHFFRQLPTNYLESVARDENRLTDPVTREYYESLRIITRYALGDPRRLREIARMNLGRIERPDGSMYRDKTVPQASTTPGVDTTGFVRVMNGAPWDEPGSIQFVSSVELLLEKAMNVKTIDLSLSGKSAYRIEALSGGRYLTIHHIQPEPVNPDVLTRHTIRLETPTPETRQIRVSAMAGAGHYSIGHFRVNRPFAPDASLILD